MNLSINKLKFEGSQIFKIRLICSNCVPSCKRQPDSYAIYITEWFLLKKEDPFPQPLEFWISLQTYLSRLNFNTIIFLFLWNIQKNSLFTLSPFGQEK